MAKSRICSVAHCGKRHEAKGYCLKHYQRFKTHGLSGVENEPTRDRTCSLEGCTSRHFGHGYCVRHYVRWRKTGSTDAVGFTPIGEPLRFFWETVIPFDGDECLVWPFARSKQGYAMMNFEQKNWVVSRLVLTMTEGAPPHKSMDAAHSCGKGDHGCVNRRHLRWDTRAGNFADKKLHGTYVRGAEQNGAKLSERDVREIRVLAKHNSRTVIALKFGVSRQTVNDIVWKRTWGWLE